MRKRNTDNKGFIAILSLLIIATISMVIAMSLLKDGVDNASLSMSSIYYENAKVNATICIEDTLIRIKQEEQFTQNLSYTLETGQACSSVISWYATQEVTPGRWESLVDVEISGTSGNFTRVFNYNLKVKRTSVHHTDGTLQYTNDIDIISIDEITS